MEEVTKAEANILMRGTCPDCGSDTFLEGPHGGLAINVMCANPLCNSKFNIRWPFTPVRIPTRT